MKKNKLSGFFFISLHLKAKHQLQKKKQKKGFMKNHFKTNKKKSQKILITIIYIVKRV